MQTDERLPAHARAEIEAATGRRRAELERWWEAWARVGDAKQAWRDVHAELVAAEDELAGCPKYARHDHKAKVRQVEARLAAADADIRAAIDRFKSGG